MELETGDEKVLYFKPFFNLSLCGEKQYVTKRSRRRSAAMNFIPPLFILFPLLFNVSVWIGLGLIVASGVLLYSFYPFIIELSNEEEALW